MKTEAGFSLESAPYENIVGAVWVADVDSFVAVQPTDLFIDQDGGFKLQDYEDEEGNVRAVLLEVEPGRQTPAWHIKRNQDTFGYLEVHSVVSGSGNMLIKPNEDDHTRAGYLRDSQGQSRFSPREASHQLEEGDVPLVRIKPGETFQVIADPDRPVQVLAVMPNKPFELTFEERAGSLV